MKQPCSGCPCLLSPHRASSGHGKTWRSLKILVPKEPLCKAHLELLTPQTAGVFQGVREASSWDEASTHLCSSISHFLSPPPPQKKPEQKGNPLSEEGVG